MHSSGETSAESGWSVRADPGDEAEFRVRGLQASIRGERQPCSFVRASNPADEIVDQARRIRSDVLQGNGVVVLQLVDEHWDRSTEDLFDDPLLVYMSSSFDAQPDECFRQVHVGTGDTGPLVVLVPDPGAPEPPFDQV